MIFLQSLTGGNGFYSSDGKEKLWKERKLVLRNKETGTAIKHVCTVSLKQVIPYKKD